MKKHFIIFIIAVILCPVFSACFNYESSGDGSYSHEEPKKIAIVYFSATGNTKKLAETAQSYLHTEIFEIVPTEPYTESDLDYSNSESRTSKENADPSARPAIKNTFDNIDEYNTFIIAHPIWWGNAPKIIYTFLESYNFSGKTIVTMATSASSPIGSSQNDLRLLAPDAKWLDGKRFDASAKREELENWFDDLGFIPVGGKDYPIRAELKMSINGKTVPVIWEETMSLSDVEALCSQSGYFRIELTPYGGFEHYGNLGKDCRSNDVYQTAHIGDIMLYASDKIVLFYAEHSYEYTKLGKIDLPDDEIVDMLKGYVTLTLYV